MFLKSKWAVGAIMCVSALLVAGCQNRDVDVDQLVKDAIINNSEVVAEKINVDLGGKAHMEQDDKKSDVEINLLVDGYVAKSEGTNPKFDLVLSGDFNFEEGENKTSGIFDLAAKMVEENLYVNMNDFPEMALGPYSQIAATLKGQWWLFPVPADSFAGISPEITKEQEAQVRQILEEVSIFEGLKIKSTEEVNGSEAYKVVGKFSKEGLKNYINEISKLNGEPVADDQQGEMDKVLDVLAGSNVEMWITKEGHFLTKVVIGLKLSMAELAERFAVEQVEGQELPKGNIELNVVVNMSEINKVVEIVVPADAKEFNLEDAVQQSGLIPTTTEAPVDMSNLPQ
ncbi:hypothetical protein COV81_02525 [Candidatus Peregrinibacteria bacterium CG11_big_fil_rev_8_21_14_0_20_41_10]|nr:MAG: hypothetical protein COV81_02525 [Candidatus Peregrinibacteria bacterium CG11_big_fil_rev_8_21_14_0_20_41_10]PIZ77578.1 MAG: hypothetical protein COY06_00475 [Candidatus Peregrinibacteria bacterium CG_4_10_14_0_2_um_filter_41_8]PJC38379.1 MAG: hypothetical protein CO045_00650 [Candidatus Peregrinibacteria bacterium CG_4_9_14_0_2_um_filter_41_14]